jgi:hypothetical protein
MARDEGDRRGDSAVCYGNTRIGRRSHAGRDAGHDFERHGRRRQRLRLLATAAKNKRVTPFEPHHRLAFAPETYERRVHIILAGRALVAPALADEQQRRSRPPGCARCRKKLWIGESIVDDDVTVREQGLASNRE